MSLIRRRLSMLLAAVGLALTASTAQAQTTMTVQVKEGVIRQTPAVLGKVEHTLSYGQRVTILEKSGESWVRVQAVDDPSQTGWMRTSHLTQRKLSLQADQANLTPTRATQREIAMAGKGFDKQVEVDYRASTNTRGYQLLEQIDKQPAYNVSRSEVPAFQQAGGLVAQENQQ